MSNPKQPPLFPGFADADQVCGFKTKDERKYEQDRKRRSKGKGTPMPKAPATGPACLRCARWGTPSPDDDLGTCRALVRVNERYSRLDIEAGTVIHINEADRLGIGDWSYLRTGEAFSCSAYEDVSGEANTPPVLSLSPVGPLIERVRAKRNGEAA